ncbi:MAG: PD-(D/E)XK nuclease family protein [Lactimicrobium sp.]|uniref:PD-(D/E)XK nuclease family protein n=1 Tax=Lactimicrobium sp. TaxID=2563780 RepID=UPI002F351F66
MISEAYRGELVLQEMALQSKEKSVGGLQVKPLSTQLHSAPDDSLRLALLLQKEVLPEADSFTIFAKMFHYPAFFQEILSFARTCILLKIPVSSLPKDTQRDKELAMLVETAVSLPLSEKNTMAHLDEDMAALKNHPDACILPWFARNDFEYRLMKQLEDVLPRWQEKILPVKADLSHALNPRQEIECIAQRICKENVPCTVILTNPASQLPVVKEVFGRYGIPFSSLTGNEPNRMAMRFVLLIEAALNNDGTSLAKAISADCFPIKADGPLMDYFMEMLTGNELPAKVSDIFAAHPVFASQADGWKKLETKAQAWFDACQPYLDTLFSSLDPVDLSIHAFEILRHHPDLQDQSAAGELMAVRNVLNDVLDQIETIDDLRFVSAGLKNASVSHHTIASTFCLVTDLKHPVSQRKVSYVAGCDGTSWPGFAPCTGLFDEAYIKNIQEYPSLRERHDAWMDCLQWVEQSGETLHYSWSVSDYEGREIQVAYELQEQFGRCVTPMRPLRLAPFVQKDHVLPATLAKELYLEEDHITGSISTIERWFACPYSWFIQSGLKVRKNDAAMLDAATIGTMQHALMETAVRKYHKQYAEMKEEEVQTFVEDCYDILAKAHPHETHLLALSSHRMTASLLDALAFLQDFEKHTSFVPSKAEYHFEHHPMTDHVFLRGTIDRMDVYGDELLRIIDYKSSQHTLSKPKVEAGLQLQLLTYLVIAQEITGLTPAGAYYYSLKTKDLTMAAASAKGRGKKKEIVWNQQSEEEIEDAFLNARKLSGWTFVKRETELDDNKKHIASLTTIRDYSQAKALMEHLYSYFYQQIQAGNISLSPKEEACTFCDYRGICRFHGRYEKIKPIKEED